MEISFPKTSEECLADRNFIYKDFSNRYTLPSHDNLVQFRQTAAFVDSYYDSLSPNKTYYSGEYITGSIVENVNKFLRAKTLPFSIKNKILADFFPIEKMLLELSFLNFSTEKMSFREYWSAFYNTIQKHVNPCKEMYIEDLNELGNTYVGTEDEGAFLLFQEIFNEFSFSEELFKSFETALSNFSANYVKTEDQKSAFSIFSLKIEEVLNEGRFIIFIEEVTKKVNQSVRSGGNLVQKGELFKLMKTSLSFALIYFISLSPFATFESSSELKKIIALIRKIIYLSSFVPIHDILPLVITYTESVTNITTHIKENNIEPDIEQIKTYFNIHKDELIPLNETYKDFIKALDDTAVPTSQIQVRALRLSRLLESSIPTDLQIVAAFGRIKESLRTKIICQSIKEDSLIILKFYQSQAGVKKGLKESIDDVISSTDGILTTNLISEKYIDFIKRIRLMFIVFRGLLDSSSSHLEDTAGDFFRYFPDVCNYKGIISIPKASEEKKGTINELTDEMMTTKKINEIMISLTDIEFRSVESSKFDKLNKVLFFISSMNSFYSTFVGNDAVTEDRFEYIIEPNETTIKFVNLIEALLPILTFQPTSSLELCEKTFALVLVTLYKPYSAKDVAERAYQGVKDSLILRFPNLSFRFTKVLCITLRKLVQKGKVDIPIEYIDNLEDSFGKVVRLDEDSSPKDFYNDALKLKEAANLSPIFESILLFSKALVYLEEVSKCMTDVSKFLENDDPVAPAIIKLTVTANVIQSISLMHQQLTGTPIFETPKEVWPFNSNQTNLIIFSQADKKSFETIRDYLQDVHNDIPTLPNRMFIDAANALIQESCVYANSLNIDPAISNQVSEIIKNIIQISITSTKNKDFDAFSRDTFGELYFLLKLLEERPPNFSKFTAIDDIQNFSGMILEYLAFTNLKIAYRTLWKQLHEIPEPFKPEINQELEFNLRSSNSNDDYAEVYNFDKQLEQLKNAFEGNEEAKPIVEEIAKILDRPEVGPNPAKIREYLQRFNAKTRAHVERIKTEIQKVDSVKEGMMYKRPSELEFETDAIIEKIEAADEEIKELKKIDEEKQRLINEAKEESTRILNEYKALREEMDIKYELPEGITQSDIEEKTEEGNKSEPAQKSTNIIEYARAISDQNTKLRATLQRASIMKRVPGLNDIKSERANAEKLELVQLRDQLRDEIQELEYTVNGVSTEELYDLTGVMPMDIPDEVKDFFEMADKVRMGRGSEINPIDFLSGLDSLEKCMYELSQNRRDIVNSILTNGGDSEEDTQDFSSVDN